MNGTHYLPITSRWNVFKNTFFYRSLIRNNCWTFDKPLAKRTHRALTIRTHDYTSVQSNASARGQMGIPKTVLK